MPNPRRDLAGDMRGLLTTYLLVTGIAAFIALAMPGLVVIGMFLIIPGLILGFAPTAFLWGCIFAVAWWAAQAVLGDTAAAIGAAVLLSAAALFLIPMPSRAAGEIAQRLAVRPDVAPTQRIAMKGDIRIDRPGPRWDNLNSRGRTGLRGFSCDNLCVALLFTPGVKSVTINNSWNLTEREHHDGTGGFDPEARTYRLVPKSKCQGPGLLPDLVGASGLFRDSIERGRALNAQWNLRLATDVCLVSSAPIERHDLLIRDGRIGGNGPRPSDWSLGFAGPSSEYVEIRDGSGTVLLRRWKSSVSVLTRFLFVNMMGGIENFRFGWARQTITNKKEWDAISLLRELEAHTNTVGRIGNADLLPALRTQLSKALDDPSLGTDSPAFQVLPAYFDALANPLAPEDLALVTRLASDDRIGSYNGIYKLGALPAEQQAPIRDAFVRRALTTADPVRLTRSGANVFVEKMAPGSFASLSPDEHRLVADPTKLWGLYAVAGRLDEGGAANVPLLLTLIRDHSRARNSNIEGVRTRRLKAYDSHFETEAHGNVVRGARAALCRLGPVAASALAPLEAMLADGTIDASARWGFQGSDWNLTLARLGKPIDQLRKPDSLSGTDQSHRDWIRRKLDHFNPDRDC